MERKFEQKLYIETITKEADPVSLGCRERNMPHDFTFFRQSSNVSGSPLHISFSSHIAEGYNWNGFLSPSKWTIWSSG